MQEPSYLVKREALDRALQFETSKLPLSKSQLGYLPDANNVVDTAKTFEKYMSGEESA